MAQNALFIFLLCLLFIRKMKSFSEKESQIQYLILIGKMRGLSVKEIHQQITSALKMDISLSSLYNRIEKMEEINANHFQELKRSNNAYIAKIMEILNHFSFYRRILTGLLYDKNTNQLITNPSLVFKAVEVLERVDQSEFKILKEIPEVLAWKQTKVLPRDSVYGSDPYENEERSLEEYVLNIEQIPIPPELEELQNKIENENLGNSKLDDDSKEDTK